MLALTHTCTTAANTLVNYSMYVPAAETFNVSLHPDGEVVDMLILTLACTTAANALVNYSMYVPQIHELFTNPTLMNSDDR